MANTKMHTLPAALHAGSIDWRPWGKHAFDRAAAEDKLVLVDVGAVWCHWCHVMDRTTYENPEVARLVGEKFIAIRVDRDQRPDVDTRLQRAVPLIRGEANGWPLTVVLTPAGHVLYKATYLPPVPDAKVGLGLVDLLEQLDKAYRQRRGELDKAGEELSARFADSLAAAWHRPGQVTDEAISQVLHGIASRFDPRFGGFGGESGPKFPHPAAIDLCLMLAERNDDSLLRRIAADTLEAMAKGGIHDHLAGGFHRYSVDRYWLVPHFEKMACDNAALLINYTRAAVGTDEPLFSQAADGILRFTREVLYDHEQGGFYGSQDADIGLYDDGDYFTWTLDEVRQVLSEAEFDAARHWFDIGPVGEMRDNPDRNVLHVGKSLAQLTRLVRVSQDELKRMLDRAQAKLLAARQRRPAPWIDKTIFADANGQYIRACCEAHKLLGSSGALELAERAADRILRQCLRGDGRLAHYLLPPGPKATGASECEVFGHLCDHAYLAWGLLGLYSITGRDDRLQAAARLLDHVLESLQDREHGGFFDLPAAAPGGRAETLGSQAHQLKLWDDSPVQSPNSIACLALLELWQFTGRAEYRESAARAIESFAGAVQPETGLFMAGWALAADMLLHPPAKVTVIGLGRPGEQMLRAAWLAPPPGRAITEPVDVADAGRVAELGVFAKDDAHRPTAIVCQDSVCLPPIRSVKELQETLARQAVAGRPSG